MQADTEGFLRPVINQDVCVECGMCIKICPINTPTAKSDIPLHVYSGWSKDDDVRKYSASGGAFAELALYFMEKMKGVVFGVAMNEKVEACHIMINHKNDIRELQGSKYVQSNIGDAYKQAEIMLTQGKKVLFSGTPCQIAGLRNYLKHDYENLYTADLICHGVPSGKVFADYIKYIEQHIGHVVYDVRFRCKKNSWLFFNMAINSHVEKNGAITYEYEGGYYSDPYIRAFLRDNALRPSCYQCQFTSVNRVSDFTFADWWGYKAETVEDKDFEKKGVSLIFCNSQKASQAIKELNMCLRERTLDEAKKTNMSLSKPFPRPVTRDEFWEDYSKMSFKEITKKWLSPEKLMPDQYTRYRCSNLYVRRFMEKLSRGYMKICRKLGKAVVKIEAK